MTTAATWRTPILVIVAGCLITLVTFGTRAGFGLFLEPMSTDMGWGRETFALAVALQNLVWGAAQPFAGALADRYGSGRVLTGGGLLYAAGVWIMADPGSPLLLHLSLGALIGLGLAGASFAIVLSAMSRVVPEERRSMALGIGTAAGSAGQFLLVPVSQIFVAAWGWQTALMLLALFPLLVVPLAVVLTGRAGGAGGGPDQSLGQAVREAGRHRGYWLLVAGFFVCGFHVAFIQTHLPAYLTDVGLSADTGAWALSLVGLFNIVGAWTAGALGGRRSKKSLLSGLYLARAVAISIYVLAPVTVASTMVFSAVIGLLWLSTVPLTSGLVAQIFGPRYMATLFGFVFFSHQVGAFIGVWLGGRLFDVTGSYDVVWWVGVALALAATLLHWPIDERPVERVAEAA